MILGIGIDTVAIERFDTWQDNTQLNKMLHQAEVDYCLSVPAKAAERFAARFALKEAVFKALHAVLQENPQPFLTVCKHIEIVSADRTAPVFKINFAELTRTTSFIDKTIVSHCSITHTNTIATGLVVLELI